MIHVKSLTKTFGDQTVLDGVSFKVERGEVVAVTGHSGGGKSTLFRCLSQLEKPTEGEIWIGKKRIYPGNIEGDQGRGFRRDRRTSSGEISSEVGFVFQNFNLFPHMTVIQNLTYAPVLQKKLTSQEARAKAQALLERNGLLGKMGSYPTLLSGGEKQRVAILRAMMLDPQVVLLDEPTSALDSVTGVEVMKMIQSLSDQGVTLMMISHDTKLVTESADRVLCLEKGRIEARCFA